MFTLEELERISRMINKTEGLSNSNALEDISAGKHITLYKQWSVRKKSGNRYKRLPHKNYVFFIDDFFIWQNGDISPIYWNKEQKKFVQETNSFDDLLDFGKYCSLKALKKEILSWKLPVGMYVRIWGDLNIVAVIKK